MVQEKIKEEILEFESPKNRKSRKRIEAMIKKEEEPKWGLMPTHKMRSIGVVMIVDPSKVFYEATNSWVVLHTFSFALM